MTAHDPRKRKRMTARQLAAALGCSERTARRYRAERRSDYELSSREKAKPWIHEGLSRATWFRRRRKKLPTSQDT